MATSVLGLLQALRERKSPVQSSSFLRKGSGHAVPPTAVAKARSPLDAHVRVSKQRYYSETAPAIMVLNFCAALAVVYVSCPYGIQNRSLCLPLHYRKSCFLSGEYSFKRAKENFRKH